MRGDGLDSICTALGITVIRHFGSSSGHVHHLPFSPDLPRFGRFHDYQDRTWHEWAPQTRWPLPDYVPDVAAGVSAPVALTEWKVKAIKLAILLDARPVSRSDFKVLELSPSRWTDPYIGWLVKGPQGYVAGPRLPDFKAQHPRNWAEIQVDAATWMAKHQPLLSFDAEVPVTADLLAGIARQVPA